MEHIQNTPPEAATDEQALPSTATQAFTLARTSDLLTRPLVQEAQAAGADLGPGRVQRLDGWTPERIGTFLHALAESGVVGDAARAAGMSRQSAYALRTRQRGRAFDIAWRAAMLLARQRLADELMSRALNGCVEVVMRNGVVSEHHRFDNRLTMAMLDRLDRQAASLSDGNEVARCVAEEFDQFVDIVCDGRTDDARAFILRRQELDGGHEENAVLSRAWNFERFGVGIEEDQKEWVEYQDREPSEAEEAGETPALEDGRESGDRKAAEALSTLSTLLARARTGSRTRCSGPDEWQP